MQHTDTSAAATLPPPADTQASTPTWGLPSFDMYGTVHKGLRFALTELLQRMAHASAHDARARQRCASDVVTLLDLLDSHGAHEDAHLHAAIAPHVHDAHAALYARHERLEGLHRELRAYASAFANASPAHEPGAYRAFYLAYARLVGEHLIHMSEEETVTQAQLDAQFSAEDLAGIQQALLRSVAPDEMLSFLHHMALGISPEERAALLLSFRPNAPEEAFVNLLARILPQLSPTDRSHLLSSLRSTS